MKTEGRKIISNNKKAYHDYFIEDTYQAGIALAGTEVKSLRQGKCNLKDSFIYVTENEAFIKNLHISPYEHGNIQNKDPLRDRKLLLHRQEINKLRQAKIQSGYSIVATSIYFNGSKVKLDIALAKGKKQYDKRQSIAKADQKREAEKEFKVRNL